MIYGLRERRWMRGRVWREEWAVVGELLEEVGGSREAGEGGADGSWLCCDGGDWADRRPDGKGGLARPIAGGNDMGFGM